MNRVAILIIVLSNIAAGGCVSEQTFLKTQSETDKARHALVQQTATLDSLKSQAAREKQESAEALTTTRNDLSSAQASLTRTQQELETSKREFDSARSNYQKEREKREALEGEIAKLQDPRILHAENTKLKQQIDHVEQLLQSSQQVVANGSRALDDANRRFAISAKEKDRLVAALTDAENRTRDLENKLILEQAAVAEARQNAEDAAGKLRAEYEQLQQRNAYLKQDRDRLQAKSDGLLRQVQASQQEAMNRQTAFEEATARLDAITQEREQLMTALAGAQQQVHNLDAKQTAGQTKEAKTRQSLEGLVGKLQGEHAQLQQRSTELRQERDQLQAKIDDLQRQLQTAQQDASAGKKASEEAQTRFTAVSSEKDQVTAALADARMISRDQDAKLSAERAKSASLNEQMQSLTAGAMKAQEMITRLEKQISQLEVEKSRGQELAMRLSERDQQIGSLRQAASDRDSVAGRVVTLTEKLDEANSRITELNGELSSAAERAILAEEDLARLTSHVTQQQAALTRAEQELERLRQEQSTQQATLRQQEERDLKAAETEKTRLEQERATKEEENRRSAKIQEDLAQALQSDIAKGEALVQPIGDRLTVIMIDRVLFDSGSVKIKPDGMKVMKRVSDVLKSVTDRHIRVEGHTDNVPMAAKYRERFPTNWEFSTARATSVIRYLVEQGGLNREQVSMSGHADTKPIAENTTEEGRAANRRIEIILSPKDQTVMASQTP